MTATASSTTATRIDGTAAFFIAHLVPSVIYHANGRFRKVSIYGSKAIRDSFDVGKRGLNQPKIELIDASVASCRMKSLENSVQSWHRCLVFCHHLITLSALTSTFGGIVRPICLAVLRLITSSNFVGCSTGRSAGLAPFRILST